MNLSINKNFKTILSSLAVAVILLLAITSGIMTGKNRAQGLAVIAEAKSVSQAINYFYQDQSRYPNVSEFAQQEIMQNYLSVFPLPQYVSAKCSATFDYKKTSASLAQLKFCLPIAISGYNAGWNSVDFK